MRRSKIKSVFYLSPPQMVHPLQIAIHIWFEFKEPDSYEYYYENVSV